MSTLLSREAEQWPEVSKDLEHMWIQQGRILACGIVFQGR